MAVSVTLTSVCPAWPTACTPCASSVSPVSFRSARVNGQEFTCHGGMSHSVGHGTGRRQCHGVLALSKRCDSTIMCPLSQVTQLNFVVDVVQPCLHCGLGCLSDVSALRKTNVFAFEGLAQTSGSTLPK